MPELRLYGASDDLIEIEGDFTEEIPYYSSSDERLYLAVSDGTLATVEYGGFWRIHVEVLGHGTTVEKHEGTDEDTDYSDILTLKNPLPFKFVMLGKSLVKS